MSCDHIPAIALLKVISYSLIFFSSVILCTIRRSPEPRYLLDWELRTVDFLVGRGYEMTEFNAGDTKMSKTAPKTKSVLVKRMIQINISKTFTLFH